MDINSNHLKRLKSGQIIENPNKYYTDSEKHFIIQEFLSIGCSKVEIWKKYTGQKEEHGCLLH